MDRTVPRGAAIALAFIYETETSRRPPECYEVIYGHKQDDLPAPLTRMTIGEVIDAQKGWTKHNGSSAAGAPQFMRATLIDLARELRLSGAQRLDADLQDRLAYHLLKRRGYDDFMAGRMSRTAFGKALAQEWASFPVLAAAKGDKRAVTRGQSYYAGDGINKALVSPERVERMLDQVKAAGNAGAARPEPAEDRRQPDDPGIDPIEDKTKPVAKSTRFWTWLTTGFFGGGGLSLSAFGVLDWRVQLLLAASVIGFAIFAIATMPRVREMLGLKT